MKDVDQYPYRISVTQSSYRGVQLTEEQRRIPEIHARRSLPAYLLLGHCSDESSPFENMQKREFYSSYTSLHQSPPAMVIHQSALFLDDPDRIPHSASTSYHSPSINRSRFVTTNQILMPTPSNQSRPQLQHSDHTFRKSLDQNGRLLNLRSS